MNRKIKKRTGRFMLFSIREWTLPIFRRVGYDSRQSLASRQIRLCSLQIHLHPV